jgi:sugar (pentulose or hexulose) kinase
VPQRAIIVIDIGKTIGKASLWTADGALIERRSRANAMLDGVLDAEGVEAWLAETLAQFAKLAVVGAIIPVAHGAAAALLTDGKLARPPMDYEAAIPASVRADYDHYRAPFSESGSPALPDGLNLGAQLFSHGPLSDRDQILLWPQYWSWLLSGVAASEVSSLGTHTDLWSPAANAFSSMVSKLGWTNCFPPMHRASDVLGPITPEWSARTGLPRDCQIYCGVHDSNAALVSARGFPQVAGREATVLSTGTWFIAMRSARAESNLSALPEGRDCLINVDVEGRPVPSARFMGGREIERLSGGIDVAEDQAAILAALDEVIADGVIILPSFARGFGPFPRAQGRWINEPTDPFACKAATALYAALMTDAALDLIGSRETLLVEGRFASAVAFIQALASLRPETAVYTSRAEADVSFGALRLANPLIKPAETLERVAPLHTDLTSYKADWYQGIKEGNSA